MRKVTLLIAVSFGISMATAGDDAVTKERKKLQGTWNVIGVSNQGKSLPPEVMEKAKGVQLVFGGDKVTFKGAGKNDVVPFKLDPTKSPKHIDLIHERSDNDDQSSRINRGIYVIDGNRLKICIVTYQKVVTKDKKKFLEEPARPTRFDQGITLILEKQKP